jgi:hypothetical protein
MKDKQKEITEAYISSNITEAGTRGDFFSMKNSDIKDPKARAIHKKMQEIEKKRKPALDAYKKANKTLSMLGDEMETLWRELAFLD